MNKFFVFIIIVNVPEFILASPRLETRTLFSELCSSRPTLSLCQWTDNRLRIQRASQPRLSEDYCHENKNLFQSSCYDGSSDTSQGAFCSDYFVRCRGWKNLEQKKPLFKNYGQPVLRQRARRSFPNSGPSSKSNVQYCESYGKNYYSMCLRGPVPSFSAEFCSGFKRACPGVPSPGTVVGNPVPPSSSLPSNSGPYLPPAPSLSPLVPSPGVPPPSAPIPSSPQLPGGLPSIPQLPGGLPSIPQLPGGLPSIPKLPAGLPSIPNLAGGGSPASPNSPSGGPASPTGGLPSAPQTPGIGGQTPGGIGIGQSLNSPFFGAQQGTNIQPLSGVNTGTNINAAGANVGANQGVNFGGLPGLSSLGSLGLGGLGVGSGTGIGRRRRKRRYTQ